MWIHLPSSVSTPVEEDSTSDSEWLFPMLAQFVTWRGMLRPSKSWSRTCKREGWMKHRSGLIPEPSTASRGVEQWIGSLVASRASHGQSQERSEEPMMNAGSGRTSDASLAKWNPEDSSWRTSQASFWEEYSPYLESWPRTGTTRSGQLFALPTLVRRTGANGALSWPTPDTMPEAPNSGSNVTSRPKSLLLNALRVSNWPAPQASDWKGANKSGSGSNSSRSLATAAEWQTPATFQGKYRRQVNQTERDELLLPGQAEHWATPATRDHKGVNLKPHHLGQLPNQVAHQWMTPTVVDRNNSFKSPPKDTSNLKGQSTAWSTPTASDDGHKVTVSANQPGLIGDADRFSGRPVQAAMNGEGYLRGDPTLPRLNPVFVEWLMGWPENWLKLTNSESSETVAFLNKFR